jgi:predicted enzyme related to lactoylglutathione lyase
MIPSPRIANIVFFVTDVDRTERFYREVVGLPVDRMPGEPGESGGEPWLIAHAIGGVDLIFFRGDSRPGSSPIIVFNLDEGGIDRVVAELASAGANIVTPVSHAPGGWSADFEDPDGYTLSLYQLERVPR